MTAPTLPTPPTGYAVCPVTGCQWCGRTYGLRNHLFRSHIRPYMEACRVAETVAGNIAVAAEPATQAMRAEPTEPTGNEPQLQRDSEKWLDEAGYWRATARNVEIVTCTVSTSWPISGWFAHWTGKTATKGAPFMPDLLIWTWSRRPLWIELKARNEYQPGQREAIEAGWWIECRSVADVEAAVRRWENAPHQARAVASRPECGCSAIR